MNINEAAREAYLKTLSQTETAEFKNKSKEEQTRILSLFIATNISPLKMPRQRSTYQQPIKMTGDASVGQIGDEVSFTSTSQ